MTEKLKKSKKVLAGRILMVLIIPWFYWMAIEHTVFVMNFWNHGTEEYTNATKLIKSRSSARGGPTHYIYQFKIDDKDIEYKLMQKLPLDRKVTIITNSNYPEIAILGPKQNTIFQLYSNSVGGAFYFIIEFLFLGWLIISGPELWYIMLTGKKKEKKHVRL